MKTDKSWIDILDEFDEFLYSEDDATRKMGLIMLNSKLPVKSIKDYNELLTLFYSYTNKLRRVDPFARYWQLYGDMRVKFNNQFQKITKYNGSRGYMDRNPMESI